MVCFEHLYDSTVNDTKMNHDTVESPDTRVDPERSTLIANFKIVIADLIELSFTDRFGFVSNCPKNFGGRVLTTSCTL